MAITLYGSAVGLFTRSGKIGKEYLRVVTSYGSTLDTAVEAIRDGYESGDQGVVIDALYSARNSYKSVHSSWLSSLKSIMQNQRIEQANDDSALVSNTLQNAVAAVVAQMVANNESILRGTSSCTVTAYGSNKGDAKIVSSFTNKYGNAIGTAYPETIRLNCTTDSTNYSEFFTIAGQPTKSITDQNWQPDEYGFYANVNPKVDHPRWSQGRERPLGDGLFARRRPTLMFNGSAADVADLYRGMDLSRDF